jgi:hypothetical protein
MSSISTLLNPFFRYCRQPITHSAGLSYQKQVFRFSLSFTRIQTCAIIPTTTVFFALDRFDFFIVTEYNRVMFTSNALSLIHSDTTVARSNHRRRDLFSWMSDFERKDIIHLFPLGTGAPLVTESRHIVALRREVQFSSPGFCAPSTSSHFTEI